MHHPLVIAEAGSCHEGDIGRAKALCDMAIEAKCFMVKFQIWLDQSITARGNIPLTFDMYSQLVEYCENKIQITASAFDDVSLDFLLTHKPVYVKFSHAKRFWEAGIHRASAAGSIPIISTSLLDAPNVYGRAIKMLCIPEYPVLYKVDFNSLRHSESWKYISGFSDHTCGIDQTIVASTTPGITFIEKHIRLDSGSTPDHYFAIGKAELTELMNTICPK